MLLLRSLFPKSLQLKFESAFPRKTMRQSSLSGDGLISANHLPTAAATQSLGLERCETIGLGLVYLAILNLLSVCPEDRFDVVFHKTSTWTSTHRNVQHRPLRPPMERISGNSIVIYVVLERVARGKANLQDPVRVTLSQVDK